MLRCLGFFSPLKNIKYFLHCCWGLGFFFPPGDLCEWLENNWVYEITTYRTPKPEQLKIEEVFRLGIWQISLVSIRQTQKKETFISEISQPTVFYIRPEKESINFFLQSYKLFSSNKLQNLIRTKKKSQNKVYRLSCSIKNQKIYKLFW